MWHTISNKIKHFFHVVSNVRPIVWIGLYVALMPVFALIYWNLPDGQFRIPDGGATDFGSWLYYSIVTITTLGFGDYTPAHGWAQGVTAAEVMCGLVILGFFLNAVGSMKSEIDVESEIEKQRRVHEITEWDKLRKSAPGLLHTVNTFLAYCYAVTTPKAERKEDGGEYNPDFNFSDMQDLYEPSGLPADNSRRPAVERLMKCAGRLSFTLDALQSRVDLTLWPELLEECFAYVANYQLFASVDLFEKPADNDIEHRGEEMRRIAASDSVPDKSDKEMWPEVELYHFIKENAEMSRKIEATVTSLLSKKPE